MRLENKVAIITGGGSGIGKEIDETWEKAIFVRGDVTRREDVKEIANKTINKFGKIDILINNAGINQDALITKMTEEQWNKVISVDLKGSFNCIQAVIDTMIDQGSGVIINASSIAGIYGNIGQINYASAKAGLIGMTKTLAKELGRKGIRVNAIAPGFITTPMTSKVPEKIIKMMIEKTPLHSMGEPADVAYAYLYLASDEANFVNGAVLNVDGGLII